MNGVIQPPETYAQWVSVLDRLMDKSDDEAVLEAMKKGTIQWQTGVAERFTQKLVDTLNYRMDKAIDKLGKEISHSGGQERILVGGLLAMRRELSFLMKVADVPAIPEKQRDSYKRLIIDQGNKIQSSLLDSAKSDRTGRLAGIIRNNRVNSFSN